MKPVPFPECKRCYGVGCPECDEQRQKYYQAESKTPVTEPITEEELTMVKDRSDTEVYDYPESLVIVVLLDEIARLVGENDTLENEADKRERLISLVEEFCPDEVEVAVGMVNDIEAMQLQALASKESNNAETENKKLRDALGWAHLHMNAYIPGFPATDTDKQLQKAIMEILPKDNNARPQS